MLCMKEKSESEFAKLLRYLVEAREMRDEVLGPILSLEAAELVSHIRGDMTAMLTLVSENKLCEKYFSQGLSFASLCNEISIYTQTHSQSILLATSQIELKKRRITSLSSELDRLTITISRFETPSSIQALRKEYVVAVRNLAYAEYELAKKASTIL